MKSLFAHEVARRVYRRSEGKPIFEEARAPTRDELQGLLDRIIARLVNMLTRGVRSSFSLDEYLY